MSKHIWFWFLTAAIAVAFSAPGVARAKDDEERAKTEDLPKAVLKTAHHYVPGLKIDDVKMRDVKGRPRVFIIDGETEDRDVVLHIEEDGDLQEIRFHSRPEGTKPTKEAHSSEELPDAVRKTAERVVPKLQIHEVSSHRDPGQERVYHIVGKVIEDESPHEVVLAIEADGDLVEARVFKPKKEIAKAGDREERDEDRSRDED